MGLRPNLRLRKNKRRLQKLTIILIQGGESLPPGLSPRSSAHPLLRAQSPPATPANHSVNGLAPAPNRHAELDSASIPVSKEVPFPFYANLSFPCLTWESFSHTKIRKHAQKKGKTFFTRSARLQWYTIAVDMGNCNSIFLRYARKIELKNTPFKETNK